MFIRSQPLPMLIIPSSSLSEITFLDEALTTPHFVWKSTLSNIQKIYDLLGPPLFQMASWAYQE